MNTIRAFWLTLILIGTFCGASLAADLARPAWCQKGWECIPTKEIAADTEYHLNLQEKLLAYSARARRFGWTVGPGIGVAGVVDSDLTVHWVPTAGFFLVFGLRF